MKPKQMEWVKERLFADGEISRNTCLANYISRLSSIIQKLELQGYAFTTERRAGDYVYKLELPSKSHEAHPLHF